MMLPGVWRGDQEDELGLLGDPSESKGEALQAMSEIDAGWVGDVFHLVRESIRARAD